MKTKYENEYVLVCFKPNFNRQPDVAKLIICYVLKESNLSVVEFSELIWRWKSNIILLELWWWTHLVSWEILVWVGVWGWRLFLSFPCIATAWVCHPLSFRQTHHLWTFNAVYMSTPNNLRGSSYLILEVGLKNLVLVPIR